MANAQSSKLDRLNIFKSRVPPNPLGTKMSKKPVDSLNMQDVPYVFDDDNDEFHDCKESPDVSQVTKYAYKHPKHIQDQKSIMYPNVREQNRPNKHYASSPNPGTYSQIEENTLAFTQGLFSKVIHDDLSLKKFFDFTQKRNSLLPISSDQTAIVELINQKQVTVISGRTGCGKTTQVPQFILEDHAKRQKSVNIIVTQPRKIAAKSIAKRICDERSWPLGKIVGYKVGLDKGNVSLDTRLLFCTTGVFKKMLIAKKSLTDWTHVVLDEVHERDMDMDFVLLICKRLINTNSRNVKLILMSATIDSQRFQKYFSWPISSSSAKLLYAAGVYEIQHSKTFPVNVYYLDDLEKDLKFKSKVSPWPANLEIDSPYLMKDCINVACQLILELDNLEEQSNCDEPGSVLVFLPGEAEISRVKRWLQDISKDHRKAWWILPLHSRIPFEETQLIFEHRKGQRKIILSTNVAESSLTIPDIYYVIDFCLQKLLMADQNTNYVALQLQWADKNSCTQRKGRVGRVRTGLVYRLVPEELYNEFCESQTAEMVRAPLEKVILDTKLLDFGSPKELLALAIEPPKLINIHKTSMRLKEIGALSKTTNGKIVLDDGDLTVLGEIIASLPVDVCLGKLILLGHLFNLLDECIIIAAGMSSCPLFSMPFDNKLKAYADKLYWSDKSFSDFLAILVAYQTWYGKVKTGEFNRIPEKKWCQDRHLQLKALREMSNVIDEIKTALKRHHIDELDLPNRSDRRKYRNDNIIETSGKDCFKLQIVIFGAFYPNYFIRTGPCFEEKEVFKELYNDVAKTSHDPYDCIYFTNFEPKQAKYGILYEDQIKNLFNGFEPRSIDVEFAGQKVFVQFTPSDNSGTKSLHNLSEQMENSSVTNDSIPHNHAILTEVYLAMKLQKEPRDRMMLKLFDPEVARQNMLEIEEKSNQAADENEERKKCVSSVLQRNIGRRDQRTMSLLLRGPHHPLMFNVMSTLRIGSCKKVNIERDSVNSVLLCKNSKDTNDIWLVAGNVGTNPAGDSLVLRSTSLLPNRRGLGALLAMSFAPNVEMRHIKMKKYTGCLLGLGYRKSCSCDEDWNNQSWYHSEYPTREHISYHPEHDMEIQFDTEIDNEDIKLINQLRYRMSIPFTRINDRAESGNRLPLEMRMREVPARLTIPGNLIEDQDEIESILKTLLSKRRKHVEKIPYKREFHWRQLPPKKEALYKPPIRNESELLLKLITQIHLVQE